MWKTQKRVGLLIHGHGSDVTWVEENDFWDLGNGNGQAQLFRREI